MRMAILGQQERLLLYISANERVLDQWRLLVGLGEHFRRANYVSGRRCLMNLDCETDYKIEGILRCTSYQMHQA